MHLVRSAVLALIAFAGLALPTLAQDEVTPFADPSRLVAIGGSLLEIVYALDEEAKLVARDTTGVYPPEASALPDVGYMRALSPEGVLAVNPSALLVVEGSGPPETLDVLSKGSVPYVTVPDDFSHEGVLTKVRTVGKALGVADKAEALAAELDQQMRAAEAVTEDIPEAERQKVLFVISVQDGKIRAAGNHTAANGIIQLAGAINPLAEMNGYQTLTDEAILTANPDFIVMMNNSNSTDLMPELQANPALASTPALKDGHIVKLDGAFLLGFGPRTPEAILALAHELYGNRVPL
jgi:iron complex transport system substrate-binding protein